MKHTPGPWEVNGNSHWTFYGGTGKTVFGARIFCHTEEDVDIAPANAYADNLEECLGNAHLISATLDLLYCLRQIISELPSNRDWLDPVLENMSKLAIAKADGKGVENDT